MNGPINVKSPKNISKWQMGFNSAFKGLTEHSPYSLLVRHLEETLSNRRGLAPSIQRI
jgi:hypothetical protein